jgi:DNA invertase Pin-like site-specific DNA recombinase
MNRASLYLRLSKAAREESTGLGAQEQDLSALADRHGLSVVAVHPDDGESGALRNRPEFLAWLEDARQGRADHLLAHKLDRVSRGGNAGLARFLDVLEGVDSDGNRVSQPVRFLSSADGLDSQSPAWDIQSAVMGALAKSERDQIQSRTKRSQQVLRDEGRFHGGTPPAGFRVVPNPSGAGKVLEPDPDTVRYLREAARLVLTESLGAAIAYLQESPLQPPKAPHWTRQTVSQSLQSSAAVSHLWTPSEARALRAEVWKRHPTIPGRKRARRIELLTGVLHCGSCGYSMTFVSSKRDNGRYRCPTWASGAPCPKRQSAQAPQTEALVTEAYLSGFGGMDELQAQSPHSEKADRLALLSDELDKLWSELPGLPASKRADALKRAEEIEIEQRTIEAEPVSYVQPMRTTGRTLAEAWKASDTRERNAMLRRTGIALGVQKPDGTRRQAPIEPGWILGLENLRDPQ